MSKHSQSIDNKVLARIYGTGRGAVFTPSTFQDLGSTKAVLHALSRHTEVGTIRRLTRGLYDYPKSHPQLGVLHPTNDAVARALTGRDATRLQPSGGYAANLLGLSEQIPMKVVYLTDGPGRTVRLGKREIILKHTTPKNMATAGKVSGLVIQALMNLGRRHVDDEVIHTLDRRLSPEERRQLMKDIRYAPAWIAAVFRRLNENEVKK
jgi:hypothetical protein